MEGPLADTTFQFVPSEAPITIGRGRDCKIKFEHSALSRVQCVLLWEGWRWVIADGNGERESTNGTWQFLDESTEMHNGMQLKIGQNLLKVNITD